MCGSARESRSRGTGTRITPLSAGARSVTLLVTGATGFVMSVLTRRWLESNVHERAVILDSAGLDDVATDFFAPVADRLQVVQGDVTDRGAWQGLSAGGGIARVLPRGTHTPNET